MFCLLICLLVCIYLYPYLQQTVLFFIAIETPTMNGCNLYLSLSLSLSISQQHHQVGGVDSTLPASYFFLANFGAAAAAGLWRLFIVPLDTCKTVLQVTA
jgi:hypothetical protein